MLRTCKVPDRRHRQIFGSCTFVLNKTNKGDKFIANSDEEFIGYSNEVKAYRVWMLQWFTAFWAQDNSSPQEVMPMTMDTSTIQQKN